MFVEVLMAIRGKKNTTTKELINNNKKLLNSKPDFASSLLVEATVSENIEILNFMLDNGFNVNQKNFVGETVLYLAVAKNGKINMIQILLNKGAKAVINEANAQGLTPIFNVTKRDSPEMFELLKANGANTDHISYGPKIIGDIETEDFC